MRYLYILAADYLEGPRRLDEASRKAIERHKGEIRLDAKTWVIDEPLRIRRGATLMGDKTTTPGAE